MSVKLCSKRRWDRTEVKSHLHRGRGHSDDQVAQAVEQPANNAQSYISACQSLRLSIILMISVKDLPPQHGLVRRQKKRALADCARAMAQRTTNPRLFTMGQNRGSQGWCNKKRQKTVCMVANAEFFPKAEGERKKTAGSKSSFPGKLASFSTSSPNKPLHIHAGLALLLWSVSSSSSKCDWIHITAGCSPTRIPCASTNCPIFCVVPAKIASCVFRPSRMRRRQEVSKQS